MEFLDMYINVLMFLIKFDRVYPLFQILGPFSLPFHSYYAYVCLLGSVHQNYRFLFIHLHSHL